MDYKKLKLLAKSLSRIVLLLFVSILLILLYAFEIEPHWLKIKHLDLTHGKGGVHKKYVHITDIHFKGDEQYLRKIVGKINKINPDTVFFTGDLVENDSFTDKALEILAGIKAPVYAITGNHEGWAYIDRSKLESGYARIGSTQKGGLVSSNDCGLHGAGLVTLPVDSNQSHRILLMHEPDSVYSIQGKKYDLILAGHTHGMQIRIPIISKKVIPSGWGRFDRGLFETKAGPMYVNPGIGTYFVNCRFLCRPEITVIDL